MPRIDRINSGDLIYHVLNRSNARVTIFESDAGYREFENILEEGIKKFNMRLLAYCLMPNHWHLVLYPFNEGDLSLFMGWITNTHTRRWHTRTNTIGEGHLYQGRFKSFICQDDSHFLTLARYVERNALKADLVTRAEQWQWSSIYRREHGTDKAREILTKWPLPTPDNYLEWLHHPQSSTEEEMIVRSEQRNIPLGEDKWVDTMITKYGIEQTRTPRGRPKKGG